MIYFILYQGAVYPNKYKTLYKETVNGPRNNHRSVTNTLILQNITGIENKVGKIYNKTVTSTCHAVFNKEHLIMPKPCTAYLLSVL